MKGDVDLPRNEMPAELEKEDIQEVQNFSSVKRSKFQFVNGRNSASLAEDLVEASYRRTIPQVTSTVFHYFLLYVSFHHTHYAIIISIFENLDIDQLRWTQLCRATLRFLVELLGTTT